MLYYQGNGEPLGGLCVGVKVCVTTIFLLLQFCFCFLPSELFLRYETA